MVYKLVTSVIAMVFQVVRVLVGGCYDMPAGGLVVAVVFQVVARWLLWFFRWL